jgi:hypothetical protein
VKYIIFNNRGTYLGFILGPDMSYTQNYDLNYGYSIVLRKSGAELRSFFYSYLVSIHDGWEEMVESVYNLNRIKEVMEEMKPGHMNCEYQYMPDDEGNVDVCGSKSYVMDISGNFLCEDHWTFGG